MAKRHLTIAVLLILSTQLKAQQYGLFNTKTMFDAFENPAQKAFVLDSSRQYATNFFFPNFSFSGANKGDSDYSLRQLIHGYKFDASAIPVDQQYRNKLYQTSNVYLLTFRIFQSYKYNKELGFSWQVRTDAFADYTNQLLVAFDNYKRLENGQTDGLLNGKGYGQSYHQFSVNYRENYNKRLAFGAKLSLLSGTTYNKADITGSSLNVDEVNQQLNIGIAGTYQSNFLKTKELSTSSFFPNFKNPGLSVGLGTTYTAKSGIFIMGSIKDLGFIRWNKQSHSFAINETITVDQNGHEKEFEDKLDDIYTNADRQKSFYTATNARADFLISKKFDFYTPNLIVSKYLWNQGGDIAFVNSFKYNNISASLTPAYNLNGFAMLGLQGMYQTPNFEFFLGTDNLLRSAKIRQQAAVMTGYTGASAYMGMSVKFGYVVEHPQNSSYMPGVGDEQETSFFSKIFGIFKKKK